jgi:hypothetical protein
MLSIFILSLIGPILIFMLILSIVILNAVLLSVAMMNVVTPKFFLSIKGTSDLVITGKSF